MIRILLGEWFKLPRVGPEIFSKLMRQARLRYDREKRMFLVEAETNIAILTAILKEALKDEVVIELPCFVCGKSAGCGDCEHLDICNRTTVSNQCVCSNCYEQKDAYERYCDAFSKKLTTAKIKI
ncbi:MAG: hypothetical protein ACE5KA_03365 [Nitrososphaerales archaeon]